MTKRLNNLPPPPDYTTELEILYRAAAHPFGYVLLATDANIVRQRLYTVRRKALDPELDGLAIYLNPRVPGEIWLLRSEHIPVEARGRGVTPAQSEDIVL